MGGYSDSHPLPQRAIGAVFSHGNSDESPASPLPIRVTAATRRVSVHRVPATEPSPTTDEMHERDEDGRPDDGPQDRERVVIDGYDHEFRKPELLGDEGTEERPDEPDRDRHDESTASAAADGPSESAANSGDDEQDQ
jgi:hypothetical protein